MSDSDTRGAFYTGLLLGGLIGAAAALLMTPQSGSQTRLQIQSKGSELQSQLGSVTSGLQDRGKVTVRETLPDESEKNSAGPTEIPAVEDGEPPAEEATA